MQNGSREKRRIDSISSNYVRTPLIKWRPAWRTMGLSICLIWILSIGNVCRAQTAPAHGGAEHAAASTLRLADLQQAFTSLADRLEPTVVTVLSLTAPRASDENERSWASHNPFGPASAPRRATGTGSGVIIAPEGWVLTNDHVIGSADKVIVRMHDGREFPGRVLSDHHSDLALIKINPTEPLPAAHLGDSDRVRIGQWAIAIGSPFRYEGSLSVGVISSLNRTQRVPDYNVPEGARFYSNMIQTDAAINPGNSGGPLCNIEGDVIGINTAIESESGGSVGIGFAIPINTAKFVIAQLKEKGHVDYGYLGISPADVNPNFASALKVPSGALLETDPESNSPAAKAGLLAGDVVTSIDAKPVHSALDLRTIISQTAPGAIVALTIVRDGKLQSLNATLARMPDPPASPPRAPLKPSLGIEVQALTKKLAEDMSISNRYTGVVIKSIDPGAAAADLPGLARGEIIVRINDQDTPTIAAFQTATSGVKSGDQVKLFYLDPTNGYQRHFVIVTVD